MNTQLTMYKTVITNIGTLLSGNLKTPILDADTVICINGIITHIGSACDFDLADTDLYIDARGTTLMPGLIDNHTHPTLGEYSPRSGNHDWIWHCLQGGVTTMISAGEVHTPGLPYDRVGIKAMAVAVQRAFKNYRPSGVKMIAGSPLLSNDFQEDDFRELSALGITQLGEVGIGPVKDSTKAAELVRYAKKHSILTMTHTGGPSIAASKRMNAAEILEINPDIIGHINGGYTALPKNEIRCLCEACYGALEIVHNGNELAAITTLNYAKELKQTHRIVIGTDSPAGCGVPALGMLRTIALLSSIGNTPPEQAICFATGNTAKLRKLNTGIIELNKEADFILTSPPLGGAGTDVLSSLRLGDLPSITSIIIDGKLIVRQSQNSPPAETTPTITLTSTREYR
ncbi:amidohydrolase family protein [Pseudomonas poae]|uniref:amidohydrolase family protein n=1 Tax=Pseudomonas poae TaxID=200451 RepID=UPI000F4B838D|nr:amidohydrolase family protein [Pseudomonas poae]